METLGLWALLCGLCLQGTIFGFGPLPHGPNGLEALGPTEGQVLCLARTAI